MRTAKQQIMEFLCVAVYEARHYHGYMVYMSDFDNDDIVCSQATHKGICQLPSKLVKYCQGWVVVW